MPKKCRICRRERAKLYLKGERCFSPKCPIDKKGGVPPGDHGLRSSLRLSGFGTQLRGKQKIKRYYGLRERELKNYFLSAESLAGQPEENLVRLLEARLDNVVYRLGFAPSRAASKQLIAHGQVKVNDQKVTIPSYQVRPKDRVELSAKAANLVHIKSWLEKKDINIPVWLAKKGLIGKVGKEPEVKDWPADLDPGLVIEYYSR
ncbi:MAG: 30S ribosomal protein S4 [Candidatus Shapirobacteria bacterium]